MTEADEVEWAKAINTLTSLYAKLQTELKAAREEVAIAAGNATRHGRRVQELEEELRALHDKQ